MIVISLIISPYFSKAYTIHVQLCFFSIGSRLELNISISFRQIDLQIQSKIQQIMPEGITSFFFFFNLVWTYSSIHCQLNMNNFTKVTYNVNEKRGEEVCLVNFIYKASEIPFNNPLQTSFYSLTTKYKQTQGGTILITIKIQKVNKHQKIRGKTYWKFLSDGLHAHSW